MWGIWAIDEGTLSPHERQTFRQQQAELKALADSNQRTIAANAISLEARDRHYRAILAELQLTERDRAALRARGLSDTEIDRHGYKSVSKFQRLSGSYPAGLPGIGRSGNTLNNFNAGYLCPVVNLDGLIIGMQVRRRGSGDGARYVWLSNAERCPVGTAEGLPLSLFQTESPILGFAEGTGPKPHIASLRLGINVIGAAGGNWVGSAEQIEAAIARLQPEQFVLYPDAGALRTDSVMLRYTKLNELLKELGHTLQVAWWGQQDKTSGDIDELSAEQLAQIEIVSWETFEKLASSYTHEEKAAYFRNKRPGDRTLTGQRTEVDQRFIELRLPTQGGCILAVSSDVSTGKTHAIGQIKDEFFTRHPDGIFDMQGYRNALLRQTAERNGGEHIRDVECSEARYSSMLLQEAQAILYCIDSLERRLPSLLQALREGRKIFLGLDEADAILKHIVEGGTLSHRQAKIWLMWCELLKAVIAGGGYIGLFEADLPQICIDAIASISGAQRLQVLENTHQPHAGRVIRFHTVLNQSRKPSDNLLNRQCHIDVLKALKAGSNTFLATDSQRLGKQIEAAAVELGYKVLRIDSETAERPEVQAFLQNPDAQLGQHQYDLLICTTSAESGLSISEGYFERLILLGSHLEDRALRQLVSRVRGMIPIDAYVRQRAIAQGENPDSFTPEGVVKAHQQNQADSAIAADVAGHFGADVLEQADKGQSTTEAQSLEYWKGVYAARKNLSGAFLRENLKAIYERSGHIIEEIVTDGSSDTAGIERYKQAKDAVASTEADEYASRTLERSVEWAIKTLCGNSAKYLEIVEAKKILDDDKWPGLPLNDPDFVKAEIVEHDRRNLKAHTFAWLCNHPKIARLLDLESWKAQLEQPFVIASSLKRESLKVNILSQIGALKLLNLAQANDDDHPAVTELASKAREHRALLKRVFRITIKDEYIDAAGRARHTDRDVCNKIAKLAGFKPKVTHRVGPRGNQKRFYTYVPTAHQAEVWAALERRWADALSSETIDVGELQTAVVTTCIEENIPMQVVTTDDDPPDRLAKEFAFVAQNCNSWPDFYTHCAQLDDELAESLVFELPKALAERFHARV